jgi:hypothetical protein
MKIAIISDTHDNLPNFKKVISWIKKKGIKVLIHCGDISTAETLKEVLTNYAGKAYIVLGNMDFDSPKIQECITKNMPRVKYFDKVGEVELGGKKIAFCHFPETAKKLAGSKKYDIVFYGHTHKPWQETFYRKEPGKGKKVREIKLVNPGNAAGLFYKATFAVYNTITGNLELKIIENLK